MFKIIVATLLFLPSLAFATAYGPNIKEDLTAICDSYETAGGGFPCENVNDGNLATRWISANNHNEHSVIFDTNASSTLGKVRFNLVKDGAFTGLQSFKILVGNNTSSMTQVVASTTVTTTADNEWQEFTWSASTTPYEFVKVVGFAANGTEREITLWEIQLFNELFPNSMTDNILELLYIIIAFGVFILGAYIGKKTSHK